MNESRDEEEMSPLQMPFQRPNTNGKVELIQEDGYVLVQYQFYHDKVMDQDEEQDILSKLENY